MVLDPFCGKGTTLFEAMHMGRARSAVISRPTPWSCRAKCHPVKIADAANYIQNLNVQEECDPCEVPRRFVVFSVRRPWGKFSPFEPSCFAT